MRDVLSNTYHDKWIGRAGLITWPPCLSSLESHNSVVYSATIENEETLHQHIFMLVKPFSTTAGPWKGCNSPCSDVLLCIVLKVEDSVEHLL